MTIGSRNQTGCRLPADRRTPCRPVRLDDGAARGEAEPGAPGLGREVGLEEPLAQFRRHARSPIGDAGLDEYRSPAPTARSRIATAEEASQAF